MAEPSDTHSATTPTPAPQTHIFPFLQLPRELRDQVSTTTTTTHPQHHLRPPPQTKAYQNTYPSVKHRYTTPSSSTPPPAPPTPPQSNAAISSTSPQRQHPSSCYSCTRMRYSCRASLRAKHSRCCLSGIRLRLAVGRMC
ncbi:predicted protein [Plenodomus lingam JN3]|uniref:Predicted protein n=1 Tax=Leptosphaeria maculans (strain JN3 / isolate v23.1.3 / race Av1-4-5-6-7-8) TaxID=985895 RepID=E4ZXJ7_LEPMJ|nr:predicted protein [Plenodomus lingam JN3]CBX95407.1 predicted protein [Plenodomus lingam JN3]